MRSILVVWFRPPAARHGAVRARARGQTLGRAHDDGDPAVAGAAVAGARRHPLNPGADALAAEIYGTFKMTSMALAATLFGPEDLRIVGRSLDPVAAGMVRIRFRARGIYGWDM